METLGYLTVRGDPNECFFKYGYDKKNSKVLYSTNKMKILNSFQGGLFTRHKQCYESGELSKDLSRLYYFLPATTDRIKKINQHMSLVFLKPIDVEEHKFGEGFNPSVLDGAHPDKEKAREVVLEILKKNSGHQQL